MSKRRRSSPRSPNFGRRRSNPLRLRNPFSVHNPFRVRSRLTPKRLVRDLSIAAILGVVVLVAALFDDGSQPGSTTATASPSVTRTSGSIPICSGGSRAERRVTCIVDGDTGWHDGVNWRLVGRSSGVDAPEISRPECQAEREAGDRATARLRELISGGYQLVETGTDRYGRVLARITLTDGRDAGDTLIREGHAQEWPNSGNPWCLRPIRPSSSHTNGGGYSQQAQPSA